MTKRKAVIADDEAQLRHSLESELQRLWPELTICGLATNGNEALKLIETHQPDIAFLDIKMPGLSGIEVAQRTGAGCLVVFVTAFDQFAVKAFENEAVDYLLKPVTAERLEKTVERLKKQLADRSRSHSDFSRRMERLLAVLQNGPGGGFLTWIKVRQGEKLRMIAVDEVCYFKSADKYTLVRTVDRESFIKKSIQQLSEALDPERFWRIHRSTIVNVHQISEVTRSFAGHLVVQLKDLPETLTVSRSYAHLFKQM